LIGDLGGFVQVVAGLVDLDVLSVAGKPNLLYYWH
jgi:hypothetical protein